MADEHETQLKNLTLVNVLILVVLFIVFIANAREGKSIPHTPGFKFLTASGSREGIFFFFLAIFRQQ